MKPEAQSDDPAWRAGSFEGARREQLRRWSRLPLEDILLAIEEMGGIASEFNAANHLNRPVLLKQNPHSDVEAGFATTSGVDCRM